MWGWMSPGKPSLQKRAERDSEVGNLADWRCDSRLGGGVVGTRPICGEKVEGGPLAGRSSEGIIQSLGGEN